MKKAGSNSYLALAPGDLNGFLGLAVDNLSVLALLAAILVGGFHIPASIVFGRMFPGTTLGVLVGDLAYTWLAARLARRTNRMDVTAMPFGLDTPSTLGMALLVLGPAYARFRAGGLDPEAAGIETWYLGMAATVTMGILKLALALCGRLLQRTVPQAALLGPLAGIALMLIGFLPLIELLQSPIAGFLTLGLVLHALLSKGDAPGRVPGVLLAVMVGTAVFYALRWAGVEAPDHAAALPALHLSWPRFDAGIGRGFAGVAGILPLIVPFALLTVVGGVNNTESAQVAGDGYDVRSILLAEGAATVIAGLAGGVAQTTPYIGHPAYKHMGARAGYTWLTGAFIGIGGMLGWVSHLIAFIPLAVLAPVLVFLALNITVQAFTAVPVRHAAAVAMGFFPSIARLVTIELSNPRMVPPARFAELMSSADNGLPTLAVIVALGNGFIITATVWGAFVTELGEGRLRAAAGYLAAGGTLALFGIIHSVRADGSMYLPWHLHGLERAISLQLCCAYLVLAAALAILSLRRRV